LPGKVAQFIELALSFLDLGFEAADACVTPALGSSVATPG
jgi:hypothetical protein